MQLWNIWLAPPRRLRCRMCSVCAASPWPRSRSPPLCLVTSRDSARALAQRQGRVSAAVQPRRGGAAPGLAHAPGMSLILVRFGIKPACARAKCHSPRAACGALPGLLCVSSGVLGTVPAAPTAAERGGDRGRDRSSLTPVLPPTDRSMSTSLSASQLHTVSMRDPLNRVLGKSWGVTRCWDLALGLD